MDYGGEDPGCVWLFGRRSKSVGAGLAHGLESVCTPGCTPVLSVTQKRGRSCGMRLVALYKCYMPLRFLRCTVAAPCACEWNKLYTVKPAPEKCVRFETTPAATSEDWVRNRLWLGLISVLSASPHRKQAEQHLPAEYYNDYVLCICGLRWYSATAGSSAMSPANICDIRYCRKRPLYLSVASRRIRILSQLSVELLEIGLYARWKCYSSWPLPWLT